jgi:hypothetical protein
MLVYYVSQLEDAVQVQRPNIVKRTFVYILSTMYVQDATVDDRGVVAPAFWAHSVESKLVPELLRWVFDILLIS